jgi:hypothetical protein
MSHVGQDCIQQAGFSTGLLALSSPVRRASMKSTLQLAKLPAGSAEFFDLRRSETSALP